MSKKIICDVCGNEMLYADGPGYLGGTSSYVYVLGNGNRKLRFEVAIKMKAAVDQDEIDVCHDCQDYVITKLLSNKSQELINEETHNDASKN